MVLPEAGQGDALAGRSETQRRMQVAGKLNRVVLRLGPRWGRCQQRFVKTGEWSQLKRLGDQLQAPLRRGIARVTVMVATHQRHRNIGVTAPELSEFLIECCCVAFAGVDQIAQNYQMRGLMFVEQRCDAVEIVRRVPTRHCHPGGTKARCLAQVYVGHEQHALLRPQQRVRR